MIGQIWIAFFGVSAVWLSMSPNPNTARWGCVCGMISQPAWFYETYMAEQWGIFALCWCYAVSWARGIKTHWLTPREVIA